MANDWVLDVLTDLKTCAKKNVLTTIAEQLENTTLIVATEIAPTGGKVPQAILQNAGTTGYAY